MGTVTNLHEGSQGKSSCDIGINKAGFNFVVVQAPEHIGSKYAIFGSESEEELKDVTVNDLLFQLNGIFLEESNKFAVVAEISHSMVTFFNDSLIPMTELIYTEDKAFTEKVDEFLRKNVVYYMDFIYPTQLN